MRYYLKLSDSSSLYELLKSSEYTEWFCVTGIEGACDGSCNCCSAVNFYVMCS